MNGEPELLLGLIVLFAGAKLGGYFAFKLRQPAVLGELLVGMLIGNLPWFGYRGLEFIQHMPAFEAMATLGVILLLFEVGLESSLRELFKVGAAAVAVATLGVVFPALLGFGISAAFLPDRSPYVHAFVGAILCATSVGITARVLKDLKHLSSVEGRIILAAAVIDDVMGLLILAVVSGIIVAANSGDAGGISFLSIALIGAKAFAFLALALWIGAKLAPYLFRYGARLRIEGVLVTLALIVCFSLAYGAHLAGLAPIVGAFAAGLIIDGTGFARFFGEKEKSIEDLLIPISRFFVPIFFIHMGMKVNLAVFANLDVLMLGMSLAAVAIIGKQLCGLGVWGKNPPSRLVIGIGMIPRGEVGLIFASMGTNLILNGAPVVDEHIYAAAIMMVVITTLITPPGLRWALQRAYPRLNRTT